MPIAGAIAWTFIGIAGAFFFGFTSSLGSVCRYRHHILFGPLERSFCRGRSFEQQKERNFFDRLFLLTVMMAMLVYAIAIPFVLIERTSLPLSVGILTRHMWIPFFAIIQHWVRIFHGVARTALIVAAWYPFPERRFVVTRQ